MVNIDSSSSIHSIIGEEEEDEDEEDEEAGELPFSTPSLSINS